MSNEITEDIRQDFERCDGIVRRGLKTFIEVGVALAEIRDRELWRVNHVSFSDYAETYGWSKSYAYRLIDAAKTAISLSPTGDSKPANERQARELAKAGDLAPDAWELANAKAQEEGKRVTAEVVKEAVEEISDAYDDGAEYEEVHDEELISTTWKEQADENDKMIAFVVKQIGQVKKSVLTLEKLSWSPGYVDGAVVDLNSAALHLNHMKFGKMCEHCDGGGCGHCKETGYIPKGEK